MFGQAPIKRSLLPDSMDVYVPDGSGGFSGPARISRVRFDEEQSASDDAHRSADAGAGTVYVDAVMSGGAFEIPAGSRVEIGGSSYYVTKVRRRCAKWGRVHHWEVEVS